MPRTQILEFKAKDFGATLRRVRQQRGLSLRDVDAQTGICYQQINYVERGIRTNSWPAIMLAYWADLAVESFVTVNRRDAQ